MRCNQAPTCSEDWGPDGFRCVNISDTTPRTAVKYSYFSVSTHLDTAFFLHFLVNMPSLLSLIALFAASTTVAANPVQPKTTAKPLARRSFETDAFWTGWYYDTITSDSSVSSLTSAVIGSDMVMVTTNNLLYVCDTSMTSWESACSQSFVTSCDGKTAFHLDDSSTVCESLCNTDTVFASNTADANAMLWIGCNDQTNRVFYQVEPDTSTTSTPTPEPTASGSPTPGPSKTPGPSPTSTPSSSPKPTAEPTSSSSKAWVAGPVIGGVAAVGLGGLLLVFLRRRKRNAAASAYQPAPQMHSPPHSYQSPSMSNSMSPPVPPYVDPSTNGYYGHHVAENKPDNLSVYGHTAPGYSPQEGTIQMPAGVSEFRGTQAQPPPHEAEQVSELPSTAPSHQVPELSTTNNVR